MSSDFEQLLREQVEGQRLSAITFVMDYVQLQFDPPPIINAFTPISVTSGARSAVTGEEPFRNLLCEQISKTVTSVALRTAEALVFTLDDGSTISLSLRTEHYRGPEAISVIGAKQFFLVI